MNKICIITFGCTLNLSDSEVMQGILVKHGFKIVNTSEKADLIIVNSCTVKHSAETHFWKLLRELKEKKKKVVIAGCITQTDPEKLDEYSFIGTTQITHIAEVVEETLAGNIVKLIAYDPKAERLNLPKIRKNSIVEIIPLCQGCLGNCTYCKTKAARFNLKSYDKNAILCQAKEAIKDGVKEIWITAQDTAAYGMDVKLTLVDLLKDLVSLKGNFKIRLGMGNPEHFKLYIDRLIPIMKNKKMFRFLHIPAQSGNNEILKKMNRNYSIKDFKTLIKKIKKSIPDITLSTDIIVGFPGETEKQFMDSVTLIKEIKPDVLNISRYSQRPKTIAAGMLQIAGGITKDRSRLITEVFNSIAFAKNKRWLNWEGEIIIDEKGKEGTGTLIGRNYAYKQVIIKDNGKIKLGDKVKVEITKSTFYDLRGRIISY